MSGPSVRTCHAGASVSRGWWTPALTSSRRTPLEPLRQQGSRVLCEPLLEALAAESFALRQIVRPIPDDPREQQVDLVDLGSAQRRVIVQTGIRIAERRGHPRTRGQGPALQTHDVEERIPSAGSLEVEDADEMPTVASLLQQQVRQVQVVVGQPPLDALERVAPLFVVLDHGLM